MGDCVFCNIANGIWGSATVYEDENFRAVLDIAPAAKGHVLLLPKKHMANLYEIDETVAKEALAIASRIAKAQKKALGCDGVNLLQNNEEAAGQSVFHLHIHLIPRYANDGVTIPWKSLSYSDGEADEYAARIVACL